MHAKTQWLPGTEVSKRCESLPALRRDRPTSVRIPGSTRLPADVRVAAARTPEDSWFASRQFRGEIRYAGVVEKTDVIDPKAARPPQHPLARWLLQGTESEVKGNVGPHVDKKQVAPRHQEHSWWKVMCLTGVDYFSTLGYQPGIAALTVGVLSPLATLVLVLLTLFGALPMYHRVAAESPHGDGSISMLERLLAWWKGKLFVLCLIGFVATSFIITITLSAADATAHIIENPFAPHFLEGHQVGVTLLLIGLLGAVFLKGFNEAVGIAVILVAIYIGLNLVVTGVGFYQIAQQPHVLTDWKTALFASYSNPFLLVGGALLAFPKLALGLSGFETGVVVMPLVKGEGGDSPENPAGRIRNTRKLLTSAALIMSVLLVTSSIVTTLLIPAAEFQPGGKANGRALAYLAHGFLGDAFGTVYDISTILILWFAGASAMAGLLNIVPRYLPRYGMAPEWTRASRPLVLVYTLIAGAVTVLFNADVTAQGGAYATGVLTLMTSAAVAVTISAWRSGARWATYGFAAISVIFVYTTCVNIIERPDGLKIAGFFIVAIVAVSLVSRVWRTTELRVGTITLDGASQRFLDEMAAQGDLRIVANEPDRCDEAEYEHKEREQREDHQIEPQDPIVFLEIYVRDPSEFSADLNVVGVEVGRHRVLRAESAAVPNAIAAFLIWLRDEKGKVPHAYFAWSEGNPFLYLIRYVLSGQGDVAPVTREILRQAEPDPCRRPAIHAGV